MLKTESAQCANTIKKLLIKYYPTIKFSVRSDNFSNGNSVDISWNLGPLSEEIEKLVNHYEAGTFDGMTDCYNYDNVRNDIPQAKYVHCQREYKTNEEILAEKHNKPLKWRDPTRIDLYKEEKTLTHIVGRDLCARMGIEYKGLNELVPQDYQHMIRGYISNGSLQDLIYQLLNQAQLMTGYHGIKNKKTESGEEIVNSFEIY